MSTVVVKEHVMKKRNRNRNNKNTRIQTLVKGKKALEIMGVSRKNGPQSKQARRNRRNANGGQINKFPTGNKEGMNFRQGKISNERDMEYIGEITASSTSFVVNTTLACNPGQAGTFPWLAKKALLYEKYQFKSLEFVYKPEVSQYASLGTTGKVILSFDYDASDSPPSSKQNAEDTDPSADGMPYEEIVLKMKPSELHKNSDAKFVRPGGLPGGSDIKTYDCGNLYVSTSGLEANSGTLGELWVRYNCVLSVPVLESTNVAPTNYFVSSQQDTAASLTSTIPYQPLFAAAASTTVVNVNGIGLVNTSGSLVPPAGNYFMDVDATFTNGTGNDITTAVLDITKNSNIQGGASEFDGPGLQIVSLHKSIYISCNGTDAITILLQGTFTNATTVTTVYRLIAI